MNDERGKDVLLIPFAVQLSVIVVVVPTLVALFSSWSLLPDSSCIEN